MDTITGSKRVRFDLPERDRSPGQHELLSGSTHDILNPQGAVGAALFRACTGVGAVARAETLPVAASMAMLSEHA
ncbi:MAG: hypothetical protein KatS3mg060_2023 [Dehalococcoidia bacterium]|nr:MAG: hypothetical protein KatS3mg060_2023 [Dehalococcoidia bacterium]